jgi:DNA transformation protein
MAKDELLKTSALLENAMPYPPPEVDLQFKFMFGGMGAFAKTRMFAAILGDVVAFKLPPDKLDEARSVGASQWMYEDKGKPMPMSTYFTFPRELIEDAEMCEYWMKISIDYALTLPAKKPRAGKRKPAQ